MAQFNYKEFLKGGGVEKYLLEENFGNDIESRFQYIRPLMVRLDDTARTEAMIDGMEEARAEDDKMAFDFYFVETMKMLGLDSELMEVDNLEENDDVLDEMIDEAMFDVGDMVVMRVDREKTSPMKVKGMRRMFGSNVNAISVEKQDGEEVEYDETQLVKLEEVEGEVQTENKLLKASNTLEDALNKVVDDLTDEQIDRFTDMILDLRDKVKAKLNEEEGAADVKTIDKLLPKINNKAEYLEILPKVIGLDIPGVTPQTKKAMLLKLAKQLK